jgi:hypothetical protein
MVIGLATGQLHHLENTLPSRRTYVNPIIAALYDPDVMPNDLRRAHRMVDAVVEKLYRKALFGSDRERAEHLFGMYEKMVTVR